MANSTLQVLIDIKSKLEGLTQAVEQMRQLKNETNATARAGAGGFAQLFKIGESIDLTRRLNDVVAEIPRKLIEWTAEGVRFNAELQTTRNNIAGVFRQSAPDQFKNFSAALHESARVVDLLREKAHLLGLDYRSVFEQYQATAGALFSGGVRDLQKQVDLTILLNQVMGALGVQQQNRQRDIIDLLTGAAGRTQAGREIASQLKVSSEQLDKMIEQARAEGRLGEFLTNTFKGIGEAATRTDRFNVSLGRLRNNLLDLKGLLTESALGGVKSTIDGINEALESPRGRGFVQGGGLFLGQAIESGQRFINKIIPDIKNATEAAEVLRNVTAQEEQLTDAALLAADIMAAQAGQILISEEKKLQTFIAQGDAIQKQQGAYKAQLEAATTLKQVQAATAAGLDAIKAKEELRSRIQAEINRLQAEGGEQSQRIINSLRLIDSDLDRAKTSSEGLAHALGVAGGVLRSMGNEAEAFALKIESLVNKVNRELALGSALGPKARVDQLQFFQSEDLARASKLASEITGITVALPTINALRDFVNDLRKPDTTALVGPKTKANVEAVEKILEDVANRQIQIKGGIEAENAERKKVSDTVDDYNFKIRQAQIDGEKFRGEDTTAAQHALDIDQKRFELTNSFKAALEAGRVTQDQINALADDMVANDERDKQLTIDKKNAKAGERDAHRDIVAFQRQEATILQGIRQQQQLIAEAPFLTVDQKNALLLKLMREEITALNTEVSIGRGLLKGGTLDAATYEQVAQKIQEAQFQMDLLAQKTQALTFGGQIKASLIEFGNNFGSIAQQIGQAITGSINTALDATSDALTGILFQTNDWRQTVFQAERQIIASLIKIGLQMLVSWAIGSFIRKQSDQGAIQSGSTIAGAYAPAAAASSIATGGSTAVIGAIAAAAAIAAIIALLVGFEEGGHTGWGPTKRVAGVIHGQEYVHPKLSVDYYGLQVHEALRRRAIPAEQLKALAANYRYPVRARLGSFEAGGAVAALSASIDDRAVAGSAAGAPVVNMKTIVLHDRDQVRRELFNSPEMEIFVIETFNNNVHRVRKT